MSSLVSVIIPTYQRATLLRRALQSIAAQTIPDWEIILVDDGSTDTTPDVVEDFKASHGRVEYIRQSNQGASAARNRGIDAARGGFIAFLDSDDEYIPTNLERRLAPFQRAPQIGLVFSDYSYVDTSATFHQSALQDFFGIVQEIPKLKMGRDMYMCPSGIRDWLGHKYFVSTLAGMVRRAVLGDRVRFRREQTYAEEWSFYGDIANRCPVGFVDESLAVHHFTNGSITRGLLSNELGRARSCDIMLERMIGLTHVQRANLRQQLAGVWSSLGYANVRAGRRQEAAAWMWRAFAKSPTFASLLQGLRHTSLRMVTGAIGTTCRGQDEVKNEYCTSS